MPHWNALVQQYKAKYGKPKKPPRKRQAVQKGSTKDGKEK